MSTKETQSDRSREARTPSQASTQPGVGTLSRTPATVLAAAATTVLLAAVTSAGSIYLTFVYQHPQVTAGSLVFVTFFLAVKATAVIAAAGMVRGRRLAWQILLAYAVIWELGFSIVNVIFFHEAPAALFGGVVLVVLLPLLLAPATRRYVNAATPRLAGSPADRHRAGQLGQEGTQP